MSIRTWNEGHFAFFNAKAREEGFRDMQTVDQMFLKGSKDARKIAAELIARWAEEFAQENERDYA